MTTVMALTPGQHPRFARFAGTPVLDQLLPCLGGLTLPSEPLHAASAGEEEFLADLVDALTANEE